MQKKNFSLEKSKQCIYENWSFNKNKIWNSDSGGDNEQQTHEKSTVSHTMLLWAAYTTFFEKLHVCYFYFIITLCNAFLYFFWVRVKKCMWIIILIKTALKL